MLRRWRFCKISAARAAIILGLVTASLQVAEAKESLRQYGAETSTEIEHIVDRLRAQVPASVVFLDMGDQVAVSYTGDATPPGLSNFLLSAFEGLDPDVIAMGQTVSLTTTLAENGTGTAMGLMVLARFGADSDMLLDGTTVVLDGRAGDCAGQLILQHPHPAGKAGPAYRDLFEQRGFAFPEASPQETSFFFGYRDDCELALYLQEQQGTSLIVIRYLED